MDWFNYDEILELRSKYPKGHPDYWSYQKLARYLAHKYGVPEFHHSSISERMRKEKKRRGKLRDASKRGFKGTGEELPTQGRTSESEPDEFKEFGPDDLPKDEPVYLDIPREYGRLEPTGISFNLKNTRHIEDWIRKFVFGVLLRELWDYLPYITEIISEIVSALKTKTKKVVLEPRKHGKTITLIGLFVWWILEERRTLLVITSDSSAKSRIYAAISLVLRSTLVRSYYGDIIQRTNANSGEIWLVSDLRFGIDPDFRVCGWDAGYIGSHPDWCHQEDPIQEEAKSEDTNESRITRYDAVIEPMTDMNTASGTRKDPADYYAKLIDRGFKPVHRRAVELISGRWPTLEDCTIETVTYDGIPREFIRDIDTSVGKYKMLGCPNFTLKQLLEIRILSLETFRSQYQNEPIPPSGVYFAKEFWNAAKSFPAKSRTIYYMAVDPAYSRQGSKGQSKRDNTAIIVCAMADGVLYVVDGVAAKLEFPEIISEIVRLRNKYRPSRIFIESNFYQVWLGQMTSRIGLAAVEEENFTKSKLPRIDSMKVAFKRKAIRPVIGSAIYDQLYVEYIQYNQRPSTASRKDDCLDALSMIYQKVSRYLKSIDFRDEVLPDSSKFNLGSFSSQY